MLNLFIYFGIRYSSLVRETNQGSAQINYSDQLSCYFHYPVKFKLVEKTTPEAINKEVGRFAEESYLLHFRKWN